MKLKLAIAAAALLAVSPALAQAPAPRPAAPPPAAQQQPAPAPKPTEAQVQKVVAAVNADKTKVAAYCNIMKIQQQMGSLDPKKDAKKLDALGQQADAESAKLGPDFEKVMDGLEQVDENSAEGKKYAAILATLDKQCK